LKYIGGLVTHSGGWVKYSGGVEEYTGGAMKYFGGLGIYIGHWMKYTACQGKSTRNNRKISAERCCSD
jgi:hypothetical protein